MSLPSISPTTSVYQVQPTDENKIIKSGQSPSGLTSVLPNLGTVSNGFTVGFTVDRAKSHEIVIRAGRNENIAFPSQADPRSEAHTPTYYVKRLFLDYENQVVLLTIDDAGNWRVTGGTTLFFQAFPPLGENKWLR